MPEDFLNLIDSVNARFIRIVWCDNGGVIRGKAVQRSRLSAYVKHGVGISEAQQGVPATIDAPAPGSGLGPVGEVRLVPDFTTLAIVPYAPGHARVFGNMVKDGKPWPLCPRNFLKRMISRASEKDLEIMSAFESEFYLLSNWASGLTPVDETAFAVTQSMDRNTVVINAIADALIAQGITVEQYYPESGPGQQEISIYYTDALSAADQQVAFRETVRAVAMQHDLRASFLPKIFADRAGSGAHLHLSLWREGINLTAAPDDSGGLSPVARQFIAGILDHLPALMALTAPSANSYRRILPHTWSGAFRCWGWDNREAAVRVPTHPEPPSPSNFELKTVDSSSNPYIALGGTIAAGLDGIDRGLELSDPVQVDPGNIVGDERTSRGIDRLPRDLGQSIRELEKDNVLLDSLGQDLARAYIAVRRAEWEALKDMSLEDEARLLLEKY